MKIEKLIEQLNGYFEGKTLTRGAALDAATALSTLQAENAQLRGELEYEQEHANAYYEECGQWEAENEKLRGEVESLKKGHCAGCSIPAVKAEQIRDLTDAPKLRAELEQVKRERDSALKDLERLCRDDIGPCEMAICELCAYNSGVQCSSPDGRSCDGYDVFNWKWRGPKKED